MRFRTAAWMLASSVSLLSGMALQGLWPGAPAVGFLLGFGCAAAACVSYGTDLVAGRDR